MKQLRMSVALRVLTHIRNHDTPSQADIKSLQGWVDKKDRIADPDQLACIVIDAESHRIKNSSNGQHGQ